MGNSQQSFFGFRRENGRVGVRNHVLILPVDDISNAAVEMVGHNIKGTLSIPHSYGRLQFGADLELFFPDNYWYRTQPKCCGSGCDWNRARMDSTCG